MLCIYVERCFESLICCLDLWLSSLLVAFIFMCFSSLEKTFFFKLDSFSTDSRQILDRFLSIEPFFLFSRQILDRLLIHQDFQVSSQQNLDSFLIHRRKFLSSLSTRQHLDRPSIHRDFWVSFRYRDQSFSIDRSSTATRQIIFCRDLVLNKSSIESSIESLIHRVVLSI